MKIFFILIAVFYFVYTFRFALYFNKIDVLYTSKQRFIHNIAIWLVPFLWIAILKQTMISTPGSHQTKKKYVGGSDYNQPSGSYIEDSYGSHDCSSLDGGGIDGDGD